MPPPHRTLAELSRSRHDGDAVISSKAHSTAASSAQLNV